MSSSHFDLHHLRVFTAVANAGNFTRAAEQLGYSQSTVTHQIKTLERKLGTPLLERSRFSKGAVLTDAGRCALSYAERLLALADETATAIRSARRR